MIRCTPRSTRIYPLFPYTTLFLAHHGRLGHGTGDGRLALDIPGGAALLFRVAGHSRRVLPGRTNRPGVQLGGVPAYSVAEDEEIGRSTCRARGCQYV